MNPCKNCQDRKSGCHASCKRYLNWKANRAKKPRADQASDLLIESILRGKRRRGQK